MTLEEIYEPVSGKMFEDKTIEFLQESGFQASRVKKDNMHGDCGVDIVASTTYKGEVFTYNIQCKYQNTPVNKQPVQEVFTGTRFYCNGAIPVVWTNNRVTKETQEYADSIGVETITTNEMKLIIMYSRMKAEDENVNLVAPEYKGLAGILYARAMHDSEYMEQVVKKMHHDKNPEVPENKNELKLQIISDFEQAQVYEKEALKLASQASEYRQKSMEIQKRAIVRNIDYG